MEIRAALAPRFVGFNTGRWDYINSVSDAMAWDVDFVNPEHRRDHDDLRLHAELRGPRAPRRQHARSRSDALRSGRAAWSRTFPVGSAEGVAAGMKRAVAGAEREQREGASGKWVAHWKMVHIVRPVWERSGARQPARSHVSARSPTREADADGLTALEPAPRTIRGARDLLSVGAAVRQRVRPGPAGGRAQAGRLLRQRRRALSDGRHGDRRNPPEHPLGVAAQGRVVTADDSGTPRRRSVHAGALRAAARRGIREAAPRRQPRRARRLEGHDAADRARDRRDLRARAAPSCRGTSTCSTSTSTTTISPKPGAASAPGGCVPPRRHARDGESRLRARMRQGLQLTIENLNCKLRSFRQRAA